MRAVQEPEEGGIPITKLAPGVSGFNPDDPSKVQRWNEYPKGRIAVKKKAATLTAEEKKERAREYQRAYQAKKRAAQGGGAKSTGPATPPARRAAAGASSATVVLAGREITVQVDGDGAVQVRVGS